MSSHADSLGNLTDIRKLLDDRQKLIFSVFVNFNF